MTQLPTVLAVEESAAELLITLNDIPESIWSMNSVLVKEADLRVVSNGGCCFVLGARANPRSSLVIFPLSADGYFHGIRPEARTIVLQRCLRAALTSRRAELFLPRSWAPYHDGSYTIFYSTTIAMGHAGVSARSIIQTSPAATPHVLVTAFVPDGQSINLRGYNAPAEAENALFTADAGLGAALKIIPTAEQGYEFGGVTPYASPSHGRTLSEWTPLLTPTQAKFLESKITGPTKVRGAAGTGKTLALMLKAVHDFYAARDAGRSWRGLILAHNWLSAEAIRSAISSMDERSLLSGSAQGSGLLVMTLQSFAAVTLHLNSPDARPISEDGHEGKVMQLEAIASLVADFRGTDWSVYRSHCSADFVARIEASRGSSESQLFAWDLMNEFACVISANRNTSREEYLAMERRKWMMALSGSAEREIVFLLHEKFREFMHDELKVLTTYDIINDLLRWLDTNSWHLMRRTVGYDAIFVDECHLFNKQEMLVFQYLSRDALKPPPAVLALDPRQSPTESFLGVRGDKRRSTVRLFEQAKMQEVRFEQVFRYTIQINNVLDNLEQCWFGFELDDEYAIQPRRATVVGPPPTLACVPDLSQAFDHVSQLAKRTARSDGTVAVLCLSVQTFELFVKYLQHDQRDRECRIVNSRDTSEALAAPGKRYYVSQPEYVAGSQFDSVMLVDANDSHVRVGADDQLRQRRLLSALYLSISRAKRMLHFVAADAEGGLIRFLRPTVESGLVTLDSI